MKNLILIGGGGHCKSVIDVVECENKFKILGILDKEEFVGKDVLGYKIIGTDTMIEKLNTSDNFFIITLGQIKSADIRKNIFEKLKFIGANIATVISPRAQVSNHSKILEGTIVMHDALVNANASVGKNCIINTKALIEHDVNIGSHCHISTSSVINGECTIGDESFIGSNSVLVQGIRLGKKTVVGAGAVVTKSSESNSLIVGNPGIIKK